MLFDCYKPTLARGFVRTSSHKLQVESSPVTAVPLTMACWFNTKSSTVNQSLMSVASGASTLYLHNFTLYASGAAGGDPVQAFAADGVGSGGGASTSTGYTANKWHHAAGVFTSAISRDAYIDGGSKGNNTASRTPVSINRTAIGIISQGSSGDALDGLIAWPAIWNIALSEADVFALSRGAHPTTIHPESLVAFWDWTGADIETGLKGAYPLTNSGSTPVNGPGFLRTRIARPWMLGAGYVATASGATPRFGRYGNFPSFRGSSV